MVDKSGDGDGAKKDPFRQRGFADKECFNRDNECPFEVEKNGNISFFVTQTKYYDKVCPHNNNGTLGISGYLVHFAILKNGRKITIVNHSEGINKLWLVCEDGITGHLQMFDKIYKHCQSELNISILPKFYVRNGKIVNRGYTQKFVRNGIEIYFKSGRDMIKFHNYVELGYEVGRLGLHMSMRIGNASITDYMMMSFAIANGMWYETSTWNKHTASVGTLGTEISTKISNMIPLDEELQSTLSTTILIMSLDIEARIIGDFKKESIDMFSDYDTSEYDTMNENNMVTKESNSRYIESLKAQEITNSAITNICIHLAAQGVPGETRIIQSYNIILIDKGAEISPGFYNEDGVWVITFKASNSRDLAFIFSIIVNLNRPDIMVGHNSNAFDMPALISLLTMHKYDNNVERMSCVAIHNEYDMGDVWANYSVQFKINQTLAMNVPKITIPGIMMFDTMPSCVINFGLSTLYVSLNVCATRLGFKPKHAMSHAIMAQIFGLLLEKPIDNNMDHDIYKKKLLLIINDTIGEFTINKTVGDAVSEMKEMRERINNGGPLNVEYVSLLQRTYKYCSHDAYIVHNIVAKFKDIFGFYGKSRITALSDYSLLKNSMFKNVTQLLGYTFGLDDCMNTVCNFGATTKNLPGFSDTHGAMMYTNRELPLYSHELVFVIDITSAYPSAMRFGTSPENVIIGDNLMNGDEPPFNGNSYITVYVPSNDLKSLIPVHIQVNNVTELGKLQSTLMTLRKVYKDRLKTETDPIKRMQYNVLQNEYKVNANSCYGIIAMLGKRNRYYHATSNAITLTTAYILTRIYLHLMARGDVKSGRHFKYSHTDSVMFLVNLDKYFDNVPMEPVAYRKFVKQNIVRINEINKEIVTSINDALDDWACGISPIRVESDGILCPTMFIKQLRYIYVESSKCFNDVIKPEDIIIKGLQCKSRNCTHVVKNMVLNIITNLFNGLINGAKGLQTLELKRYMCKKAYEYRREVINMQRIYNDKPELSKEDLEHKTRMSVKQMVRSADMSDKDTPLGSLAVDLGIEKKTMIDPNLKDHDYRYDEDGNVTLYGICIESLKKEIALVDTDNLSLFETSKKYKANVANIQVNKIVRDHNMAVQSGVIDAPFIKPGQQIQVLNVLVEAKWRLNGSKQTVNARSKAITSQSFDKKKHTINMAYYLKVASSDLASVVESFGYNKKYITRQFNEILVPCAQDYKAETSFFNKWYPLFALMINPDGEDYLGLAKYITYGVPNLFQHVVKYLEKIETGIINNVDTHKIILGMMQDQPVTEYRLLRLNSEYIADIKSALNGIEDMCVLITQYGYNRIDEIYVDKNVGGFFDDIRDIIENNRLKINEVNDTAKQWSLIRIKLKVHSASVMNPTDLKAMEYIKNKRKS